MGLDGTGGAAWRGAEAPAAAGYGSEDRVGAIHAAILEAVVEQRLPPGTKLPEDQLASHFAVSRTLVRGALRSLAQDGIVVLARHRGASVASPTPGDARDLFDARRVVEAETTRRAAARASAADCLGLDEVLVQARDALKAGDRGRAIRLSGHFHALIARIARQGVLQGFLEELIARSSLVIALYGHRGRSDCGDAEHAGLVEALRARDGDRAVALMAEHLRHIEADLDLDRQVRASLPLATLLANRSALDEGGRQLRI